MNAVLTFACIIFAYAAAAQPKDTRAILSVGGQEISVSPDEQLWIVNSSGDTYFSSDGGMNWHEGPIQGDPGAYINGHFDNLSFFNEDTAIITGYIEYEKGKSQHSGYYLTHDRGKTWELRSFGGDAWVYSVQADATGRAWLCGDDKTIYYSADFGHTWTPLILPYQESDRTYGFFMYDGSKGIAGSENNELFVTEDNWNHSRKIPTPYDQGLYPEASGIKAAFLWDGYYIVKYYKGTYYADTTNVKWKPFPVALAALEINKQNNKLYAVSDDKQVLVFNNPEKFQPLNAQLLPIHTNDLTIVNNHVYALGHTGYDRRMYRINKDGYKEILPFTTDKKIDTPHIVRQGKNSIWGIDYNHVYKSDNGGKDWYRVTVLNFTVADFRIVNDNSIIMWDGSKNNYKYTQGDPVAVEYTYVDPLKSFLNYPVTYMMISSGTSGCFHHNADEIVYRIHKRKQKFEVGKVTLDNRLDMPDRMVVNFKNSFAADELDSLLRDISLQQNILPGIASFNITSKNKKNYLALLDSNLTITNDFGETKYKDTIFYRGVLSKLDTLSTYILKNVLDKGEDFVSTTNGWFNVEFVNANNDTIRISSDYYHSPSAWHLPWHFTYKGKHFNSYSIEFSRFIRKCLPPEFRDKYIFSNKHLIMDIADYLYRK